MLYIKAPFVEFWRTIWGPISVIQDAITAEHVCTHIDMNSIPVSRSPNVEDAIMRLWTSLGGSSVFRYP